MDTLIFNSINAYGPEIYLLIFLGLMIEGEGVLFAAFYLVHQEKLDLPVLLMVAVSGVIAGDNLWFLSGRLVRRVPLLGKILKKVPAAIDEFIRTRAALTIIVSKFLYGFHRPILLYLHGAGVKYPDFLKGDVPAALLWVGVMSTAGYFFSSSLVLIRENFKYWQLGFAAVIITFIVIYKLVSGLVMR
jgi:membrane protein DedA with SNARE-associated domain